MKNLLITTLAFLSINSFASDCPISLDTEKLCAEITWTEGPFINPRGEKKFSTLEVKFFAIGDELKTPVNANHISVYPWMVMHGMEHGTRPVETKLLPSGNYQISKIFMRKMMGHWEIRFAAGEDFNPKSDYISKITIK